MKRQSIRLVALALLIGALAIAARAAGLPNAIYTMNVDGSDVRKLARVDGFNEHLSPRWSHDGKRVAFDAMPVGGGVRKIFVVNADGSGLRDLGNGAMPVWSPDDKQIGYHVFPGGGRADLYVQNVDGEGRTQLGQGHSPRWSPDGSRMASIDGTNVSVVDLVSGDITVLFAEPYFEVFQGFSFTPDGKRLAVAIRAREGEKRQLLLVDSEGAAAGMTLRLQANHGGFVSFSPDGKRLVYSTDNTLHILDVAGNAPGQRMPSQRGQNRNPDWSPDGKKILFVSDRDFK